MKRNIILAIMCTVCTMTASAQGVGGVPTKGFAVFKNDGQFKPYAFTRHAVGDNEIQIEILYAGICHIGGLKNTRWFPDTRLPDVW